jgi:hypothetical protein
MSKTRIPSDYILRPVLPKNGAYVALPTDVGSLIVQSAAAVVTLPPANSVPNGAPITVKALIAGASIQRAGTDTVWSDAAARTTVPPSGSMNPGESYNLRSDGTSVWYEDNGSDVSHVNGLPAVPSTAPAANSLVATDGAGLLPIAIMPTAVVQLTAAQTLTNKILTTPHFTDPVIDSGALTITTTASQIIPGATSFAIRNNANSANNLIITDAGVATLRGSLTSADIILSTANGNIFGGTGQTSFVTHTGSALNAHILDAGGFVVDRGGLTVTAGNIGIGTAPVGAYGIVINGPGNQYGIVIQNTSATGAQGDVSGAYIQPTTFAGAFTTTNFSGIHIALPIKGAGSTVTSAFGLLVDPITSGNTNNYGIYIGVPSGGSSNNIALCITGAGMITMGGGNTIQTSAGLLLIQTTGGDIFMRPPASTGAVRIDQGALVVTNSASFGGPITVGGGVAPGVAGTIGISSASVTTAAAGGASALPSLPCGYLVWNNNGTIVKIPYYNN